jgi:hypothetical protein
LGATDCVLLGEEGKPDPQNTIDDLIDDMRTSVEKLLKSAGTGTLAKQAQAEVDKQIAELGDRINSIVTSGGVDIVAKKKVLAEERNDSLLKDALNLVLRSSFTLSEKFPGISFLKLNRGLELTEESFKERVTPVLTAITTGKRTEVEKTLSVEIEVLKVCMAILANIGETFQDREVSVLGELTSLKAKIQTKPQIVTRLMIDRLKSSVNLRAEIIGANKFDNNFLYIVNSGAKGTASNVAQVLGSIGPQDRELIDVNPVTGRSLPFSTKWSLDPVATGFCASSFGRGMDPIEFWHHASASRGNIIESNLKPKDTGYFYRRAWVMMGDIVTHEDGSARNESGRVVQFAYGGDMFDPRSLINVKKEAQFIHVHMAVKIVRSKAGKKEFEYQTK